MQAIEIGNAVDPEQHRLAIDHELPVAVLARGLGNPWEAVGPVVAAAGDQAYAVAVALQVLPIANLFGFMEASRGGRGPRLLRSAGRIRRCFALVSDAPAATYLRPTLASI